jgi:hypothetical protein
MFFAGAASAALFSSAVVANEFWTLAKNGQKSL